MKVVHVNASDLEGGAARAANRLHQGLLKANVDSTLLVQSKSGNNTNVIGPQTNQQKAAASVRPFLDKLPTTRYKNRSKAPFSPSWLPLSGIPKRINDLNPDIVHLHWIGNGMLSIEEIADIKAPIVWTLHDSWAFTGGCHVRLSCEKYQSSCGACPVLGSEKISDLSHSVFKRKLKTYSKIKKLTVTGPSVWLSKSASDSPLFKGRNILTIPIPLDTTVFSPVDKLTARRLLSLPEAKKLILFGAKSATEDLNKGFKLLIEALNKLVRADVELLVVGSNQPEEPQNLNHTAHYLGTFYDNVSLKLLYSAADVIVVPSLQEAFGQMATESLSCGTPVVAFGSTGLLDIVDHKKNGYLATPYETNDLAYGIDWVLSYPNASELAHSAREKVLNVFDATIIVQKYLNLYKEVIESN
ncbi:glycosyltransferase family 4 protein [Pontibacter locisalis]|uniref:Glycosyltransferase family 4 protein n=1 Tax=Pontibacter locisalis TaxID=1719035 RepID=A0ABW5IGC5_9BACT